MNRHKMFYIDVVKEIDYCGTKIHYFEGSVYEKPFPVKRSETKHTLENCENCTSHYNLLIKEFGDYLQKFPNCCEYHRNLNKLSVFKYSDFLDAPKWSAQKIMYSYHHFMEWIDEENWYNEIIDYFEYCIDSYGSVPAKCGEPFQMSNYINCLLHLLKSDYIQNDIESDNISKKELTNRTEKIISYLNNFFDTYNDKTRDVNLLLTKYNEWFKIFPFEMEFFKPLKEKYKMTIPIFNGRKKYNKYLDAEIREIHTKESLAEVLINTTKKILSEMNSLSLYENGSLDDVEKLQLSLILENRRLKLKAQTLVQNENVKAYIKTLKNWFKDEKEFIKEITPYLDKAKASSNNNRPNRTDIAYFIYYLKETKELKLENSFPSDKAWTEIGNLHKKNSKNIQQVYNSISNKVEERLNKSKINNIKYVIYNMLNDFPKAQKLAKDELKLAELNS